MTARARAWLAALAALLFLPSACAATSAYLVDGVGDDWSQEDLIAVGLHPPADPNATVDLTGLSAADNATHWFFRLSFAWTVPGANATVALYLFGPDDGSPARQDPLGAAVTLPAGAPLVYAIYLELGAGFPAGSKVVFFDGVAWKNRTFAELGLAAALNSSAAFVELAAARDSLTFLSAGSAAAAVLMADASVAGSPLAAVDAVPDEPPTPSGTLPARARFFDYAYLPPVVFTALGISDPFAVDGDSVEVFVELTNAGPKNATGISAQVLVDGVVVGARQGLFLLADNGTAVVSAPWTVSAGPHNVTARSFPGGAERSLVLQVPGAVARLSIAEATARPPDPAVGEPFAVEVRVRNDGNAPSSPGTLLLKQGTQVVSSAALPPIAPGNSTTVSLPARASKPGALLLRVEIDGVNSANSTAQVSVAVQPAQGPLGIPALAWLIIGTAACGAAAWLLTPRLARLRGPPPG